jgi:hypothetical protein
MKQPTITIGHNEMQTALLARSVFITSRDQILRKIEAGAVVEDCELRLDVTELLAPVPDVVQYQAAASPGLTLRRLLDGRDIHALGSHGLHPAARKLRRHNAALFRALVSEIDRNAERSVTECKARLHKFNDWSQTQRLVRAHTSMRRSLLLLRAARILYLLHWRGAANHVAKALDSFEAKLASVREMGMGSGAPVVPIRL